MKRKNINIFKIIWITGIFLLLITILLMVMDYKINYEYLTENNLYFYNCNNSVCTAYVKDGISKSKLYSTYKCGYKTCPTIKKILGNSYAILSKDNINILYDFINNKMISNNYEDYILINDKYFIITINNYQGLIDINNNIIINPTYQQLGYNKDGILQGYNLQNIIVKDNDLYGIITIKEQQIIKNIEYKEENIEELLTIINS